MPNDLASGAAVRHAESSQRPPVEFSWKPGRSLTAEELSECAALYSRHYGTWTGRGRVPNGPISQTPGRLARLLNHASSWVILARHKGHVVAYASAVRVNVPSQGDVMWVTQLVVHKDLRNRGLAKGLLSSMWTFSDLYAWGLVTANPFAVRALEKATRRRCDPRAISSAAKELLAAGRHGVNYLENARLRTDRGRSVIDTRFFVHHQGITRMLREATVGVDWTLGPLRSGEEWFAFTFRSQPEFPLEAEELTVMLADVDAIAQRAYQGMALDKRHRWMQHTEREIDFIVDALNLQPGASVLDFGCGSGRHALELSRRGYSVVGVDFSRRLVQAAQAVAREEPLPVEFLEADCRTVHLDREFDAAICLYDVVGTFPEDSDNHAILLNLRRHVRPGGGLVLSVLNFSSLQISEENAFDPYQEPGRLQTLRASELMQESGQIFDPDFYLVDVRSHVVYRKERFDSPGDQLPAELIVRDRRYTLDEISLACTEAGFRVLARWPVRAGRWEDRSLDETAPQARELLVIARGEGAS